MTPERWQQVRAMLSGALERAPADRAAYLDQVSTEPSLRREVESLLAQEKGAEGFLEAPALEVAARMLSHGSGQSLIGRQIGSYQVLSLLGAGGMGEVYRARDPRLDRDVALKVLPTGALTDEATRRRFRKEALTLAKLNHPNIATVFEFDAQDGVDFLVMEHIAGRTLAEKIGGTVLGEREVASLGGEITAALEEAHEHGVVHRDLKPGNVMVTEKGQVKVLDFGLAKLLRPVSDTTMTESFTETQAIAGTLPYMAPEQLRGEPADARTDIHALGAVLYEMATNRRPFQDDSVPRLTDAILHQLPTAPRALNPRLSLDFERVILKCLEKDPQNRYQSAKEVGVDLRRLALPAAMTSAARPAPAYIPWRKLGIVAGIVVSTVIVAGILSKVAGVRERLRRLAGPPSIESIAVLPLENLSHDPDQDYFADGMTEQLITNLAQISALKVISRTSVMQYKGTREPLPQIAKELGVDAVIEGSVQRSGDRVGINVQLIDAQADRHLWARNYERAFREVLSLEDELARAIAGEIRVQLTPQEQTRLASSRPVDPDAHLAYLMGLHLVNNLDSKSLDDSILYFRKAIDSDPGYALAYAGLANAYIVRDIWGGFGVGHSAEDVRHNATRALELDPNLAQAHLSLAEVHFQYEWNWAASDEEFQRALTLNPNLADAYFQYAYYLQTMGKNDEAIASAQKAAELDPLSATLADTEGRILFRARHYTEAIDRYRHALELEPAFRPSFGHLAEAYEMIRDFKQALENHDKFYALGRRRSPSEWELGSFYALTNQTAKALEIVHQLEKEQGGTSRASAIAHIYAALGNKDVALGWLKRGVDDRSILPFELRDPQLDALRGDPRFANLLHSIGLQQ